MSVPQYYVQLMVQQSNMLRRHLARELINRIRNDRPRLRRSRRIAARAIANIRPNLRRSIRIANRNACRTH